MKKEIKRLIFDLLLVLVITVISFLLFGRFDVLEQLMEYLEKYERFEVDEIFPTFLVLVICLSGFAVKRWREERRARFEAQVAGSRLQGAFDQIKLLNKILPLCSYCKKIRNDNGGWEQVDVYLQKNSEADISHGICPECLEKHYPEISGSIKKGQE